jgi:hypothetical protein
MFKTLKKMFPGRPAAKAAKRQARPQVEALDGRLLPSSIPSLVNQTLYFVANRGSPYAVPNLSSTGRSLRVVSEQDNGNGTGTLTGWYQGNSGYAAVTGTISFKSYTSRIGLLGSSSSTYADFEISYSGVGLSNYGIYGGTDVVQGDGDVLATPAVNFVSYSVYYIPVQYFGWSSELSSYSGYVKHQDLVAADYGTGF